MLNTAIPSPEIPSFHILILACFLVYRPAISRTNRRGIAGRRYTVSPLAAQRSCPQLSGEDLQADVAQAGLASLTFPSVIPLWP